jgi:acyl-coenzyme A thioesterase PaaI-like protein
MNLKEIPFVNTFGIQKGADGNLRLPFDKNLLNHVKTIAAGAQFALAETASGEALKAIFPNLAGKIIPVLRDSQIKFKKPATSLIIAYPEVSTENIEKFSQQFSKKGRALISVTVTVKDTENTVTCIGNFSWFIQKIDI